MLFSSFLSLEFLLIERFIFLSSVEVKLEINKLSYFRQHQPIRSFVNWWTSIFLLLADIMPNVETASPETREFLQKVIDILLDYVNACNDRNEKILDFHHPEDMKKLLDLEIADQPVPLQQLIVDCATTLKYQVKTGEYRFAFCGPIIRLVNKPKCWIIDHRIPSQQWEIATLSHGAK